MSLNKIVVFLIGATGVGKTEVSVILATKINAQIISADSMQVYRTMDIGTAKPNPSLRRELTHHLIDILDPQQEYSAADFAKLAKEVIEEIHKNSCIPLVVGGSGLYIRALTDGIFPGPQKDKNLRINLLEEATRLGSRHLYEKLTTIDPQAASKIHPNDIKRIIRALEVCLKENKPISQLQKNTSGICDLYKIKMFGLTRPRQELYERIEKRVDEMFEEGLPDEARRLYESKPGLTSSQALGYKQLFGFFEGKYSQEEAKRLIKRDTRHFAKRQMAWFCSDKRIEWINIENNQSPQKTADIIAEKLS